MAIELNMGLDGVGRIYVSSGIKSVMNLVTAIIFIPIKEEIPDVAEDNPAAAPEGIYLEHIQKGDFDIV